MTYEDKLKNELVSGFNQFVREESIPRIIRCLHELDDNLIWQKPCANCNSIANLILHLIGNAKQYISAGIGGVEDIRHRRSEFECREGVTAAQLESQLLALSEEMAKVLGKVKASQLMEIRSVQCYEMTVLKILLHVMEHFSYHTGQIVYYTKLLKDQDLRFYDDDLLNGV